MVPMMAFPGHASYTHSTQNSLNSHLSEDISNYPTPQMISSAPGLIPGQYYYCCPQYGLVILLLLVCFNLISQLIKKQFKIPVSSPSLDKQVPVSSSKAVKHEQIPDSVHHCSESEMEKKSLE